MKFIVILLVLGLLPTVGFMVGAAVARRGNNTSRLNALERRELVEQRRLLDSLTQQAAQHVTLGDGFAPIVLDEVFTTRRKIEQ